MEVLIMASFGSMPCSSPPSGMDMEGEGLTPAVRGAVRTRKARGLEIGSASIWCSLRKTFCEQGKGRTNLGGELRIGDWGIPGERL